MFLDRELALENVRPLLRSEYERMVAGGILTGDDKVELLEGILVTMSPEGPAHAEVISRLNQMFVLALRGRAQVRVANPFAASDRSEPEPDVALVPSGAYWSEHPSQAFLLIEVADSSVRKDRGIKRRIYARSGAPEYWVIDVRGRIVEVHSEPSGEDYKSIARHSSDAVLCPRAFPDVEIRLAQVFPPVSPGG